MRSILLTVLLVALVGASAAAQVPRSFSFQGRARDAAGNYPDGTRSVTVRIVDAATGGSALFTETHTVSFERGAFTILIGMRQPGGIPSTIDFNRQLWLDIAIENFNGGAPLTPRLRILSSPSALNAETSEVSRSLTPGATVVGANDNGMLELANDVGPGLVALGGTYAVVELGVDSTSRHFVSGDTLGSADAPNPGSYYRDNAPIAWALVEADGTILTDFGVARVTHTGTGAYDIVLDIPAVMVANPKGRNVPALAPIVQPSYLTDTGQPISAQWQFRPGAADQDRRISVQTFVAPNGSPIATDASFSILVFGRPAK